jgi:hypothetical protein
MDRGGEPQQRANGAANGFAVSLLLLLFAICRSIIRRLQKRDAFRKSSASRIAKRSG